MAALGLDIEETLPYVQNLLGQVGDDSTVQRLAPGLRLCGSAIQPERKPGLLGKYGTKPATSPPNP